MNQVVRVAHTRRAAGNAPMRMAIERGFFTDRGIDVVMQEYPRGAVAVEAVESGAADAAVVGGALLHMAMRGADPRIVMNVEAWNVLRSSVPEASSGRKTCAESRWGSAGRTMPTRSS